MNKNHLVEALVEKAGLNKNDASIALDVMLEEIIQAVGRGEVLKIRGFGTFTAVRRKSRKGYNIHSREVVTLPEKNIPKFSPGKTLVEAAKEANVRYYEDGSAIKKKKKKRPEEDSASNPPAAKATAPAAPEKPKAPEKPARPAADAAPATPSAPTAPPASTAPSATPAEERRPRPSRPDTQPGERRRRPESQPGTRQPSERRVRPQPSTPSAPEQPAAQATPTAPPKPEPKAQPAQSAQPAPTTPAAPEAPPAKDFSGDPDHKKALRIARVMVKDLKLYHNDKIEKARKSGNFYKAMERDLKDMRGTYDRRVPERVRRERDYLAEWLEKLANGDV